MTPTDVRQQVEEQVAQAIAQGPFWLPGETVVVAVSGGADSLCLLHALYALRPRHGGHLHVAHLDHGLRGAVSAAEMAGVVEAAHALGLPVTAGAADVPALMAREGLSAEEAARRVRYRFLAGVAAAEDAAAIALGHTADDQAETVLMHILRGTGLDGLRGMRPTAPPAPWMVTDLPLSRSLRLVRPLLRVARAQTVAYCAALGLEPAQDEWNRDPRFLRVRLRQQVLPLLETVNPRFREALLHLAELAAWQEDDLEGLLATRWPALALEQGEAIRLDLAAWRELPRTLRLLALRRAVREVRGHLEGLTWESVVAAGRLDEMPVGSEVALIETLVARREYDSLVLGKRDALQPQCAWPDLGGALVPLLVPGRTVLPGGHALLAEVLVREEVDWSKAGGCEAWLDADACGSRLWLRNSRPGDRFRPLGMEGQKKLHDFFVDEKVPRGARGRVPLVVAPRGIAWVVGYRPDDRFRIGSPTRRILHLRWESPGR